MLPMELYLVLIFVFSGLGIIDAAYLAYHTVKGTPVECLFFPKEWCLKVQYSKQSKTFGIPNSYAGLVMYAAIFVLALLHVGGNVPFWPIQTLIAIGFIFAIYFTFVQALVLRAFCTWCVVSAVNFIVLALAAFVL